MAHKRRTENVRNRAHDLTIIRTWIVSALALTMLVVNSTGAVPPSTQGRYLLAQGGLVAMLNQIVVTMPHTIAKVTPQTPEQIYIAELRDFDLTNKLRCREIGCESSQRALAWSPVLALAARAHVLRLIETRACWRDDSQYHKCGDEPVLKERIDATGYDACAWYENVHGSWGNDLSAENATKAFWTHPPHHKNMVNVALKQLGVAVAIKDEQLFFVQVFGTEC